MIETMATSSTKHVSLCKDCMQSTALEQHTSITSNCWAWHLVNRTYWRIEHTGNWDDYQRSVLVGKVNLKLSDLFYVQFVGRIPRNVRDKIMNPWIGI